MSVDRPTFHESWHRVAPLKPRLRTAVQSYRQVFRGRVFHVLAEPASNQYYRLDEPAYHFVALLDGRRSVSDAWDICNDQLGDAAPTQGEAIQLLGQLYGSNLLHAELAPDSQQMFQRYRKRIQREVSGYLVNFLFARIPIVDPHRFLKRWVPLVGWIFSPVGFVLWAILIATGFYELAGHWGELWQGAADPEVFLNGQNLLLLYLCFAVIKAIHELGHGFSCVYYGRKKGIPTTVHTIGIMLMVLMPVPYVDASSSWALASKWQRAMIGAAGMYVELAVAAIAAIVWTHTTQPIVHSIAYNSMVIASVSTILFNANPLLRFDGYYILSDLLEIANLAQRCKDHFYYLARHYLFGIRHVQPIAHSTGERVWLVIYAIASSLYRVFISIAILIYVMSVKWLFFVGVLMAAGAIFAWVLMPIGKYIHYLLTHGELHRVRTRAVLVTVGGAAIVIIAVGLIPFPDRDRAEGVVESQTLAQVYMASDGFVKQALESGSDVGPDTAPILTASNHELKDQKLDLLAALRGARVRMEMARKKDPAITAALGQQIVALDKRLARTNYELAMLTIRSPFDGVWWSPKAHELRGVYLHRGDPVGVIADPKHLIIRAITDQSLGPRVHPNDTVEIRLDGEPSVYHTGKILQILPAAQQELPSPALGYAVGGTISTAKDDRTGRKSAEPFFEIRIQPDDPAAKDLRIGQRVIVRITMQPKPLLLQWYRILQQLIQQRFDIPV